MKSGDASETSMGRCDPGPSSELKMKSPRRRAIARGIWRGGLKSIFGSPREAGSAGRPRTRTSIVAEPRSRPPPGDNPKLSGTGRPEVPSSCANSRSPDAECEIDNRIGVEVAQRDRARQGRTGQRRVDLGDLDRALGPAPDAIESHGHVRRIAELRFVDGVIRQHSQAHAAPAQVHVETELIGAGPKIHAAVCNTTIEQRVGVAPHVEQTPDVEPTCLDVPRAAHRSWQLAD